MKELAKAIKQAQAEALRTGNKYSVFKDGDRLKVAGSKSKDNGRKIGTAVPKMVFGNMVVHYYSR